MYDEVRHMPQFPQTPKGATKMNHIVCFWNPETLLTIPHLQKFIPCEDIIVISNDAEKASPELEQQIRSKNIMQLKPNEFSPAHEDTYTVVVNGEPTSQTFPVIKKLLGGWSSFRGSYQIIEITPVSIHTLDERGPLDDWTY